MSEGAKAEAEDAHRKPLLSLLLNTASSLLNTVVSVEEPTPRPLEEPTDKSLESIPSLLPSAISEPESLVDFFYELAGFSNRPSTAHTEPPIIEHPVEASPIENSRDKLFDAADLKDLGFDLSDLDVNDDNTQIANSTQPPAAVKASEKYQPPTLGNEIVADELPILDSNLIEKLHFNLPAMLREASNVSLLYSLEKHGISISTLYKNTAEGGPCVVVVKDTDENVFGAFINESLSVHVGFYGNGESFLWKLNKSDQSIQLFPATGKNGYFVLAEPHCIAFGGGDGHFGLFIDNELFNGSSQFCETFDNQPLSEEKEFCIAALEIWGFDI